MTLMQRSVRGLIPSPEDHPLGRFLRWLLLLTAVAGAFGSLVHFVNRPRLSLTFVPGSIALDSTHRSVGDWKFLRGRPYQLDVLFKIENRYGTSVEGSVVNLTMGPLVNVTAANALRVADLRSNGRHFVSFHVGTLNPGEVTYPASLVVWFPDTLLALRFALGADSVALELDTLVATLTAINKPPVHLHSSASLRVGLDSIPYLVLEGLGAFRLSKDIPLAHLLREPLDSRDDR